MTSDKNPAPPVADCWFLTGSTAAGKTRVGVELARRIGAEIVSLDSMALYQGMDIGTAKPAPADRARVPHHLLDLVPPTEEFSLSQYIDAAHAAIAEIRGRGREVLFVGGTPLYLKSLLRGVHQGPPADWEFRRQIDEELKAVPIEALHQRLQVIDPLLAAKLHPNDKRRIIRGLEVYRLTGQRLSHLQTQFDEAQPSRARVFVLAWPREELHRRIDARVEQMFAAGLVEEVRGLLAKHSTLSRTAMQAVGYREVIDLVHSRDQWSRGADERGQRSEVRGQESGERSQGSGFRVQDSTASGGHQPASGGREPTEEGQRNDELAACLALVQARTRQFARRQETWFRSLSECQFVPMHEQKPPELVADEIVQLASGAPPRGRESLAENDRP